MAPFTFCKWHHLLSVNGGKSTGLQTTSVVNEAGLYKIIMRSNKPIAQPFQEFVCEEILPSIRKTGEYKYIINTLGCIQNVSIVNKAELFKHFIIKV